MADDITESAFEAALDKFHLATKGAAKDNFSDLTPNDIKVLVSAFDELQRETNLPSVERDSATGEYTVSGHEVSYSTIVEDEDNGRVWAFQVAFDRESGMAKEFDSQVADWLKDIADVGAEKPATITDEQWSEANQQTVEDLEQPAPTDKTFSGEHFAAVMAQWPNGEGHLAFIAETALRGDGAELQEFGTNYAIKGNELIATFHDGDIRRTDASSFLTAMEQNYPAQLEAAKKEIADEQFAAKALELRTEIVAGLREQGEGSQHQVEGGSYSIEGRALVLRDEQGDVSGRWLASNVKWELTAEQANEPEADLMDILAEDIFPDLANEQIEQNEQIRSLPVSDAVLDEVFAKNADPYMRSVHGLDERATPALSPELVAQLAGQPSKDEQRVSQFEGFPTTDLAKDIAELNATVRAVSVYWAENPPPFQETHIEAPCDDEVDYGPVVEDLRKLRFAVMADRAEAAARDDKGGRTLETTNEQGA